VESASSREANEEALDGRALSTAVLMSA